MKDKVLKVNKYILQNIILCLLMILCLGNIKVYAANNTIYTDKDGREYGGWYKIEIREGCGIWIK